MVLSEMIVYLIHLIENHYRSGEGPEIFSMVVTVPG